MVAYLVKSFSPTEGFSVNQSQNKYSVVHLVSKFVEESFEVLNLNICALANAVTLFTSYLRVK